MYAVNWSTVEQLEPATWWNDSTHLFPVGNGTGSDDVVTCLSWVYDQSQYSSTIVSRASMHSLHGIVVINVYKCFFYFHKNAFVTFFVFFQLFRPPGTMSSGRAYVLPLAYFGPQTKKLLTLINVHPNALFRETISRPLGGAAP